MRKFYRDRVVVLSLFDGDIAAASAHSGYSPTVLKIVNFLTRLPVYFA